MYFRIILICDNMRPNFPLFVWSGVDGWEQTHFLWYRVGGVNWDCGCNFLKYYLTRVRVILNRIQVGKGFKTLACLQFLLFSIRQELCQLFMKGSQWMDLLQPSLDLDSLFRYMRCSLPHMRRIIGPKDGNELLTGIDPFVAKMNSLVQCLLYLTITRVPQIQCGAFGLDKPSESISNDVHEMNHSLLRVYPIIQSPKIVQAVVTGLQHIFCICKIVF